MTDLEERLRQGLGGLAEQARPDSIRPLRDPVPGHRSAVVRWLAPVMAVVAVLAVVTVAALAGPHAGQRPTPQATPGAMPAYYVTLDNTANGTQIGRVAVTVRSSVTGAVLASTSLPPVGPGQMWISGAADDRKFVLSDGSGSYLLLKLSPDGHITRLSKLPGKFFTFLSGPTTAAVTFALSPDGHDLAFAVNKCPVFEGNVRSDCEYGITVVSLVTGASKSWTESRNEPSVRHPGYPQILQPSWNDNGQQIAFGQLVPTPQGKPVWPVGVDYRLLNVAGAGGSLLADSRQILSARVALPYQAGEVTPDGQALILPAYTSGQSVTYLRVLERSVLTGRLLRVLHLDKVHPADEQGNWSSADCLILSLGPSGLHALVQCNSFGRLDGSRFTPLPGAPSAAAIGTSFSGVAGW